MDILQGLPPRVVKDCKLLICKYDEKFILRFQVAIPLRFFTTVKQLWEVRFLLKFMIQTRFVSKVHGLAWLTSVWNLTVSNIRFSLKI